MMGVLRGCLVAAVMAAAPAEAVSLRIDSLDLQGVPTATQPNAVWDATRGAFVISWQARLGNGCAALQVMTVSGERRGTVHEVARGCDWLVNWADFPALAVADNGDWATYWLQKTPGGGYRIRFVRSADGGVTWSAPVTPHADAPAAEHGFLSMAPTGGDGLQLLWLDGGGQAAAGNGHDHDHGNMALRSARSTRQGLAASVVVDERVCSCCGTDLQRAANGALRAVFRDRSGDEIRDTGMATYDGQQWRAGGVVHPDGWQIAACPVNGPALAMSAHVGIAAWTTMGGGDALRVRAARLTDRRMVELEAGPGVRGRVDAAPLGEGAVLVWLGAGNAGGAVLQAAFLGPQGAVLGRQPVHAVPAGRDIGFPRLASNGRQALLVWAEAIEGLPRVQARWIGIAPP